MRILGSFVSVIVGLLACVTAWAAEGPDISGTLVDAAGAPVSGAAVRLLYCEFNAGITGRAIGEATTDGEGKFAFAKAYAWDSASSSGQLPPRYCLLSTPAGGSIAYLNLQQGDASEGLRLQAEAGQVMGVSVVDAEGKPVADARVWLLHAMPQSRELASVRQMLIIPSEAGIGEKTSAEGKADVLVPANTMSMIGVEKPGYAIGMGATEFTLHRGGTITGRVIGSDGKPVEGAKVTFNVNVLQGFSPAAVKTDSEGRYELKDVPGEGYSVEMMGRKQTSNGKVTLSASLPAGAAGAGTEMLTLKPGQSATQDITIKPLLQVAGVVVDAESNQPVPGIQLRMHSYSRMGGGRAGSGMTKTDEAGRFSFSVTPNYSAQISIAESMDGEYLVDQEWLRSNPIAMQGFNVQNLTESKTDVKLPIRMHKLAPLTGKVVDSDGKPAAKANVSINPMLKSVMTDEEGNFAFKAAPTDRAGEITVTSQTLGAMATFAAGQAQITITALPLVSRECIVQTPEGEPAGGLSFMLLQSTSRNSMRPMSTKPNKTDDQGKCRLEGLISGASYSANWSPAGDYGHGNAKFEVPAADEPIRFTAPKYNKSFGLIVENEDGEPVPDARVQFHNMNVVRNDQWGKINNLKTDAEGALRIEGLAGGAIEFQIHAPNYRWHQVSAMTSDGDYLATLTRQDGPPRHIVVVRTPDGKPVAEQSVRAFTRGAETQHKTDAKGRIEMPFYDQPTDVMVVCQHPEFGWAATSLQWHQDGMTTLMLRKPQTPRKIRLVAAEGKPVPSATVSITGLANRHSSESGGYANQSSFYNMPATVQTELGLRQVTDANGVATFPQVDARLHAGVRIESQEFGDQHKSLQENGSAAGDEIRIQKLATIAGAVILPPDARMEQNRFHVQAQATNQMGGGQGSSTNQDGWFEMKVEPGEYQLAIMSSGSSRYMVRNRPVVKVGPGEYKEVDVELKEGIPVRGKYIPKSGKLRDPRPQIGLQIDENMGISPQPVNADGSFEFFVPRPGDYVLFVESSEGGGSYRPHRDSVKVPSEKAVEGLEIREE